MGLSCLGITLTVSHIAVSFSCNMAKVVKEALTRIWAVVFHPPIYKSWEFLMGIYLYIASGYFKTTLDILDHLKYYTSYI